MTRWESLLRKPNINNNLGTQTRLEACSTSLAIEGSTLEAASEEDLACRVQRGCEESFAELDRRLRPRLVYVLQRRLRRSDESEDVAQQALFRAFQKIEQYDARKRFSGWIFTIALRLAADHNRRRYVASQQLGDGGPQVIDRNPGPDELAIAKERRGDLWSLAEQALGCDQWTALWLHYGEGQSVRDIARAMRRTSVSVRVLLHRARKALMLHLEQYPEEPEPNSSNQTPTPIPITVGTQR